MRIPQTIGRYDLVSFIMGFNSTLAQIVLIRELLTVARGNEFIIGFIYASWFCGIFAGARFTGSAAEIILKKRVVLSLLLLPLIFLASVLFIHVIPFFLPRAPGTLYPLSVELTLSLLLTWPASFFLGYFFPAAVSLAAGRWEGHAGGRVYSLESAGSFAGAVVFSLLLLDIASPLGTAAIMTVLSLLAAIPFSTGRKTLYPMIVSSMAFVVLGIFSGHIEGEIFRSSWKQTHTGELKEYRRSSYQLLSLEKSGDQISLYGDGMIYITIPDDYEIRYPFHLIAALAIADRPSILLFGSGSGSLPHNLAAGLDAEVVCVDIDPAIDEILKPYLASLYPRHDVDKGIHRIADDMRRHLDRTGRKYDIIFSTPPPPHNAMLNRYYTTGYFRKCRDRLLPGGVMITALPGFGSYLDQTQRAFVASIVRSFNGVFPNRLVTTGEKMYLIGSMEKGSVPNDPAALIIKYGDTIRRIKLDLAENAVTSGFHPEELGLLFEKTHMIHFASAIGPLLSTVPENSDMRPAAYWRYAIYSSRREGSLFQGLFLHFETAVILPVIFAAVSLFILKRRRGRRQFAAGTIMAITGFISITVVIILILLYQNKYGHIYSRIASIQALTMLGLGLGAAACKNIPFKALHGIFALMASATASIPLLAGIDQEWLFWLLLFALSLMAGAVFPLLYRLISTSGHLESASTLDSTDFLGALCGSLAAALIVPTLGMYAAIFLCTSLALIAIPLTAYLLRITVRGDL